MNEISLSEFYDLLNKHDWYSAMSDDSRMVTKGRKAERELLKIADQGPEYAKLFEEFEKYNWSGKAWNTKQLPKPERPKE